MPWHVAESSECPASKPWAVIKDADGEVEGCHMSKEDAQKQMAALYVAEPIGRMMDENASTSLDDSELRFWSEADMELREEDPDGLTLAGHFAVFGEWTEINSRYEGRFMERVAPGAFRKTFAENRKNMRVLYQHGKDPQLGEMVLGPIADLREDKRGAYYEVPLLQGVPELLVSGLREGLYGSSFRFRAMKEERQQSTEPSDYNPEALPERTITEAKVMEFGPVTFPAYEGATACLRSVTDWWHEQNLRSALEVFAGGAAALGQEEEPTSVVTPPLLSRRTHDHLATREEVTPWRL